MKKNKGGSLILVVGTISIIIVTVCAFNKDYIIHKYYEYTLNNKYLTQKTNEYYLEDNFNYVDNAEDTVLTSKQDIINSIYFLINSGTNHSIRYCSKDYEKCYQDVNDITSNAELLTNLNSFVHPYNSFVNISINYKNGIVEFTIKHIYSENDINTINNIINDFIDNNINNSMSIKEKIKIIHDYIINNADYDTLKTNNKNDETYSSNTAYGVLVQGYGICSGYSDAMAIFLDKLNVINYKISNDQHIWNIVYLDGEWLHLDLTWDDPISENNITRDNYFLITTKALEAIDDENHYYNKSIFSEAK